MGNKFNLENLGKGVGKNIFDGLLGFGGGLWEWLKNFWTKNMKRY